MTLAYKSFYLKHAFVAYIISGMARHTHTGYRIVPQAKNPTIQVDKYVFNFKWFLAKQFISLI